ncbi:hypothetical protein FSP39_004653 [Pinctada imbricata]|uniref:Uncharacterized protein n=1 Tax=Pinctada imbricata TaxID=66713 RepID=A0AA88YFR5_PINIB|nr:hypothetical protein FSP39_004653 [Pinctada imbricata]
MRGPVQTSLEKTGPRPPVLSECQSDSSGDNIHELAAAEHGLYYVRPLFISIYIFICVVWAPAFCGLVCVGSSDSEEVVLHHNCGDRLYNDLELMLGYKPIKLWLVMWKFITPVIIMFVWLWSIIQLKPVKYGDYLYPVGAIVLGYLIAFTSIVPIPIGMAHTLYRIQGSFKQVIL